MKSTVNVASPPPKPLMVYDGDCRFCAFWIRRWRRTTGDLVDYSSFQDLLLAARFPELSREQCEASVQLVEPDGRVYSGAEAALRTLAKAPHHDWLLQHYYDWPVFAECAEGCYSFVARHRRFFSILTRLAWGVEESGPPTYCLARWIFLRMLGLIYFAAFLSLWVQITGLVGEHGILPVRPMLETIHKQAVAKKMGANLYHVMPTLCWFNSSDSSLKWQCAAGTALAVLVLVGVAPAPCLFLLWAIYLSLATVCGDFLNFQWDYLLLEVGLLAIFFAPLQLWPRLPGTTGPSRIVLWLLKWVLFRLMFESGCVKLLSHDPAWHHLTALSYHYETQPLPTWVGWYAHQLPAPLQKVSVLIMFVIELGVPFLIFAPRRPRHFAAITLIGLQVFILLTGNYCFFNWLTMALCVLLFDDQTLRRTIGRLHVASGKDTSARPVQWARWVTTPLLCLTLLLSVMQFFRFFGLPIPWPRTLTEIQKWVAPFRSWNTYGLFAVMTTSRPEIIVEGSNDGEKWVAYEFKYKPGDVQQRPQFVAPHQPRLDWQMWFAALGTYEQNPWLLNFCGRLLEGSPEVVSLLKRNPFPDAPPRFIRAAVYDYHFTDFATRRSTGAWWRRELRGGYLPIISLRGDVSTGGKQ